MAGSAALETRLDLSDQHLKNPNKIFLEHKQPTKVLTLKLSHNPMLQLTEEVSKFANLKELILSESNIQQTPNSFNFLHQLKHLETLHLFGNGQLQTVPPEVLSVVSLKELNAGKCGLSDVPAEIANLTRLEKLHLRENSGLQSIPSSIFSLINLTELNMSFCRLRDVPAGISNLTRLTKLHLFGNEELHAIPLTVFNVLSLKELNVGRCGLTDMPPEICKLTELTKLHLRDNAELGQIPTVIYTLSSLTELHVAQCGLSTLSPEVANLCALQKLHLFGNEKLHALPPQIASLQLLTELNVSNCGLSALPPGLHMLQALEKLHLRGNRGLLKMPDTIFMLAQLRELNMGDCGLSVIPEEIGDLTRLEKLHLFQNEEIHHIPAAVFNLKKLKELNLSACGLLGVPVKLASLNELRKLHLQGVQGMNTIPSQILMLSDLRELDLSDCSLSSVCQELASLKKLVKLDLSGNAEMHEISPAIFELTNLKELSVAMCGLSTIPVEIVKLEKLEKLDFHGNKDLQHIKSSHIELLVSLKELNMAGCGLSSVPELIADIQQLVTLDLSDNDLDALPDHFSHLTQLQVLDVSSNQRLSTLPVPVTKLHKLRELNIGCCGVRDLPRDFAQLTELEVLHAYNNNFTQYPMAVLELHSLKTLDLSNKDASSKFPFTNSIKELPTALSTSQLVLLGLRGNPMVSPPSEICDQGIRAVRQYLGDLSSGIREICAETVNTLGDTGAGKTSIVQSLHCRRPQRTSVDTVNTHVMEQTRVKVSNESCVMVNDFGGHAIYQTVIPIFLPPTGLGILAYDMSEDLSVQKKKVGKWMTTSIAKSPGIRLIVAGSHLDVVPPENRESYKASMRQFIDEKIAAAIEELEDHISDVEYRLRRYRNPRSPAQSSELTRVLTVKHTCLLETLENLKHAKSCPLVCLSCETSSSPDSGYLELQALVESRLKAPAIFPVSWCRVINDILHPDDVSLQKTCYLKMEQVQAIFKKHFSDADETLKTILSYLVATSQIIWFQKHPRLSDCIFHRVNHVIEICKAVLHREGPLGTQHRSLPKRFDTDVQLYNVGQIKERFLEHLLKPFDPDGDKIDGLKELLIQFDLISLVCDSRLARRFIIPSRLPDCAQSKPPYAPGDNLRIHAQLRFEGDIIPLAFFETVLALVLTTVHERYPVEPACWRDGMSFRINSVTVVCQRLKSQPDECGHVFEIAATSATIFDLCEVVHSLLTAVSGHVMGMWKGAIYTCVFLCPGCISFGRQGLQAHTFPFDIDQFGADSSQAAAKHWCNLCELDIPLALVKSFMPEHLKDKDKRYVAKFLDEVAERRVGALSPEARSYTLVKLLKQSRASLVENLDEVSSIVDHLWGADAITQTLKERVEGAPLRMDKVRLLLDAMETEGDKSITCFLAVLKKLGQRDLVGAIANDAKPQSP